MSDNRITANQKDDTTLPVSSCGKCSACGVSQCAGHDSEDINETTSSRPQKSNTSHLVGYLASREGWQQSTNDDDDRILIFNNPHTFFNLHLNIDKGLLIAREKEGISGIDRHDVQELFTALADEYNSLKDDAGLEDLDKLDRTLRIQIPKPAYYDLFLDKVLRKNLLPDQLAEQKLLAEKNKALQPKTPESDDSMMTLSTTPTPLSMRPKPKGIDS